MEAFGSQRHFLFILTAVLISYVMAEVMGVPSINEIAMEREVHRQHHGKTRQTFDVWLEAKPGAFAIGKAPHDILWPAFCHVLSVRKGGEEQDSYEEGVVQVGDVLRVNFTTYEPEITERELCAILGEQDVYGNASVIHSDPRGPRLTESTIKE